MQCHSCLKHCKDDDFGPESPRVLVCSHTFCWDCYEKLAELIKRYKKVKQS